MQYIYRSSQVSEIRETLRVDKIVIPSRLGYMALPRYPIGEEGTLQYYEPAELASFDLSGVRALDGKGAAVLNAARGLQGRGGGFRAGLDKAVDMYTELHNNVLVPHYGAKPINRLFGAGQGAKPQGAVAQAPMKGGSSFSIGDTFSDPNVGVGDFGSSFGIGGGTPKTGVSFEPHGGYGDNFSTIPQSEFKSGDPRDPSPYQGDPFKEEAPAGTFAPTTPAPPVVRGVGPTTIPQSRLGNPNTTDTLNVSEPMGDVNEDYDVPVDETFGGGDSGIFELDTLGPGSGVSGKITADTLKPGSGISGKIPADTRGPVDSEFEKVDMSSGFSETVPPITASTLSPDRFGGGAPLTNPFDIPLSGGGAGVIGAGTSSEGVKAVVDSAIEEFKRTGNDDVLIGLINNLSERVRVLGDLAGLGQATPEQLLELSSGSELLQYIRESLRIDVDIDGGVDPQGNLTPGLRPDDIDSAMELIPNETGGVRAW